METQQHVVRRSRLFSAFIWSLAGISITLLLFAIVQKNVPGSAASWPWKLQLLDVPTATTATFGTVGAAIARAQFARSVQPVLSYGGLVVANLAPNGVLAWKCSITNAASSVAVVTDVRYWVELTPSASGPAPQGWLTHDETVALLTSLRQVAQKDFSLVFVDAGAAYVPQVRYEVAWFTSKTMGVVADLFMRVRVSDRAGDLHERTLSLLKGAIRHPTHPSMP
ncbi:hypothetical protein ACFC8N_47510 [Streptomyces sp. NPDC055966]|uniref:hypothetical protein n=1 Tax=Streptomyces sp. NPDC055966 TaxID=3345669 RepID=UPI0035D80162